jgi:hypothetical protein
MNLFLRQWLRQDQMAEVVDSFPHVSSPAAQRSGDPSPDAASGTSWNDAHTASFRDGRPDGRWVSGATRVGNDQERAKSGYAMTTHDQS